MRSARASVDILDFVDVERDWLREPSAGRLLRRGPCRRPARCSTPTARPPIAFIDWADDRWRPRRAWPRSAGRSRPAETAGDALTAFGRSPRGDDMPGLTGDPVPPVRHVTSRRIVAVRGESLEVRDDRVVGEAPLEIRAAGPAPGPGRGRGHDADARATRPSSRSASCGRRACSTARRSLGTSGGDPATLSQPDDTIVVRLSRAVRRFDGRRAPFRRDRVVRDLRQGLDRRGRAPRRPAAGRAGRRRARSSSPCRTCCAPPSGRSTRPAASTRPALFTPGGELIAIREDVGRHNALDKLVGSQVLAGAMPLHDRILMVSAGSASRSSRRRPWPASRSSAPCRRRRTSRSRPPSGSA